MATVEAAGGAGNIVLCAAGGGAAAAAAAEAAAAALFFLRKTPIASALGLVLLTSPVRERWENVWVRLFVV